MAEDLCALEHDIVQGRWRYHCLVCDFYGQPRPNEEDATQEWREHFYVHHWDLIPPEIQEAIRGAQ